MANNNINELKQLVIQTITDKNFGFKDVSAPKAAGGKVEIIIDGVIYTTTVSAEGKWSFTPPAEWAEGNHTMQITVIDKAGNRNSPLSTVVNLDTQAPDAPEIWRVVDNTGNAKGNLNPGDTTDELKPVLSGVSEPNAIVYIYDNGDLTPIASVKANSMGAWTITPDLADGDHSLTAVAKDSAKHESPASAAFNLKIESGIVVMAQNTASESDDARQIEPAVATNDYGVYANASEKHQVSNIISLGYPVEPNAMVLITINNEQFTVRADADGKWAFKTSELEDGAYFVQVRLRDKAGNLNKPAQVIVHVEAAAPEAPQIMRVIDDEGKIDHLTSGQYTDDKTPTLSGVAQPGSMVFIYGVDAAPIGSVQASKDGRWSFTPTLTTDDTYVFSAAYQDNNGRMSAKSANFTLKLDATAPDAPTVDGIYDDVGRVTGFLKSGDTTDDTTLTVTGKADAGSIVRIWDGNVVIATVVANNRGDWSLELDLPEGPHALRFDSVSKGGSASAISDEFIVNVDTKALPPAVIGEIVSNENGVEIPLISGDATNDTTPVMRGVGEVGEIVYVYDGDDIIGSVEVEADGTWEIELDPLDETSHELKIKIEDPATGKSSDFSDPVIIVVDVTAPDKPTAPEIVDNSGDDKGTLLPGTPTDETKPEFKGGGANPGDTVEIVIIDDKGNETVVGTGVVGDDGNWTVTPTDPIADGEYEVVVDITDPAGNKSDRSDPIDLIIDTQAPAEITNFEIIDDVGVITGQILDGGFTDDKNPTVRGTGEDGSKILIMDGTTVIGSVIVAGGQWSFEIPDLGEGAHNISVQPVSAAGVKGPISTGIGFEVDLTASTGGAFENGSFVDVYGSVKTFGAAGIPDINGQVLKFNGTGMEDGDIVVLYGDTNHTLILGSAVVTAGKWTLESETLTEGDYQFSFAFRDAAGNETFAAQQFGTNIDITPPDETDPGEIFPDSFGTVLMNMSLNDIMSMSEESLFIDNGKTQLMIADAGKEVSLEDILPQGEEVSNWSQANGTVTVAGVEYNVYQNNGGDAEVMVPQHLIQEQH